MEEKAETAQHKTFPWGSLAIYLGVVIVSLIIEIFAFDIVPLDGFGADSILAVSVIGVIFISLLAFIGTLVQYAFIKFPTQWVAKDEFVYKFDIWSALFLSNAINNIITLIFGQLGLGENLFWAAVVSAITSALFLFFYLSGDKKEPHVKRAIIIVRVVYFVIGIVLLAAFQVLISNMSLY